MGQLLRHSLVLPSISGELDKWMCTAFIDAVRDVLKMGGFAQSDRGAESGGTFMVGLRGRLFTVHGDFQVCEDREPWAAVGCGHEVALGSLWTTAQNPELRGDPEARIRLALDAAENYCTGVRSPFEICSTEYWPPRILARGVLAERRG
jgi:hypothetical protein